MNEENKIEKILKVMDEKVMAEKDITKLNEEEQRMWTLALFIRFYWMMGYPEHADEPVPIEYIKFILSQFTEAES